MSRNDAARTKENAPVSKWSVVLLLLLALPFVTAASVAAAPRDRDRDRLSDRWERRHHVSSAKADPDHDGLRNLREYRLRTNPRRKDTDRDGLRDGAEVRRYRTNPRRRDTDRDGLRDGAEVRRYRTNPRKKDTDGDGYGDGEEVRAGTDPRDRNSHPPQGSAPPASATGAAPGSGPGSGSGFPDASSTGVPAGTTLTAYSGPSTITTANTVIDGKIINDCLRIKATGVIIRNSKVVCHAGGGGGVEVRQDEGGGLLIEDSEITCASEAGTALEASNFTARRLNIWGCENGGSFDHDITFEDSYIHDLYEDCCTTHTDGIQFANPVSNVTIRNNTIHSSPGATAAIFTPDGEAANDKNILIEHNILAGGGYTLYCPRPDSGTNFRVIDNHFSTFVWPKVGFYGPSVDCGDEIHSGNVFHETGASYDDDM
jgi:hypothetical protein